MTYSETYTSTNLSSIVIDVISSVGVQIVAFAGLVGLVILYVWFRHNAK